MSTLLFAVIIAADVVCRLLGVGFQITEEGGLVNRTNIFVIGYILYIILLLVLMRQVRQLLYRRVMIGFYGTMGVSVLLRMGQLPFR